jgi:predicted ATPase
MKRANLTNNLLPNDRYKSFMSLMNEQGARFTATELQHGTNAMELLSCRVEFEPSMQLMTKEERSRHDFDADWQHILNICSQFGFQAMWPARIERLLVRGFKTFADATVEMKPCNVLIGGNGAGKSNLLSLLKMLRAMGRGELQVYVQIAGRANDVLHRAVPPTSTLEVGLDLVAATGKSQYRLLAERTDDDALLIRAEVIDRFDVSGKPLGGESLHQPVRESTLADASRRGGEHQLFTGLRVFHFAETAVVAPAAHECEFSDNHELREDGRNLAAFLLYLLNYQPTAYRRIVGTVRQALAGFGDFVLQPSGQNPPQIRLRWRMQGTEGDYGAHLLSDGTLRFILLTTLLSQPPDRLPKIIAIDEPELGLHPAALNLVVSLVRVASHHCQVIVATQSAAVVDQFEPEEVIVVHRQNGASTLERLSSEALADWLAEYALGELWEKNVFGGGPFG